MNLSRWFHRHNLTQRYVARRFGMSDGKMSGFCTGTKPVPGWMKYALAGILLEKGELDARSNAKQG